MNAFLSKKVGGKAMDPSFDPSRLTPVSVDFASA